MLKAIARKVVPLPVRDGLRAGQSRLLQWKTEHTLRRLEKMSARLQPGDVVDCSGYRVKVNDGLNFFMQYKDIFIHRFYHFEAENTEPFIIDCGSNIGMSMLYFKHVYPGARVLGFEPDPRLFYYLDENIRMNHLENVETMSAAVSDREGTFEFLSDGKYGSYLASLNEHKADGSLMKIQVPCVRLLNYLNRNVDLLKMNIEGAECSVLTDCGDSLRNVSKMIIEYHHLPGLTRNLHTILMLLHSLGFEYLLNDFDSKTNPAVLPPFRLDAASKYFLLIYASRKD